MIRPSKLFIVLLAVFAVCGCARTRESKEIQQKSEPVSISQAPDLAPAVPKPAKPAAQAKKPEADKVPAVIDLGNTEEIPQLNSFKKLQAGGGKVEKQRIDYLLERLARTSYNFVRNGETHNGKTAGMHMRYKLAKYGSEIQTAEDFVIKIASGSRASNEPYYVKANNRFYHARDVLLFELGLLEQKLKEQQGKAAEE